MEVSRRISPARQRILDPLMVLGSRAARRYYQYPGLVNVLSKVD